jgi:hypothetical protein
MQGLHHSDIMTYALTRLAMDYARDKQETLRNLRRYTQDSSRDSQVGISYRTPGRDDQSIPAPRPSGDDEEH